jgi:hypothetical protein
LWKWPTEHKPPSTHLTARIFRGDPSPSMRHVPARIVVAVAVVAAADVEAEEAGTATDTNL